MPKENLDRYIVIGLEHELQTAKARVQELEARLQHHRKRAGARSTDSELPSQKSGRKPKRRKMSAEARKRIGDAQRKRWAKQKAAKK